MSLVVSLALHVASSLEPGLKATLKTFVIPLLKAHHESESFGLPRGHLAGVPGVPGVAGLITLGAMGMAGMHNLNHGAAHLRSSGRLGGVLRSLRCILSEDGKSRDKGGNE